MEAPPRRLAQVPPESLMALDEMEKVSPWHAVANPVNDKGCDAPRGTDGHRRTAARRSRRSSHVSQRRQSQRPNALAACQGAVMRHSNIRCQMSEMDQTRSPWRILRRLWRG